MYESSSSSTSSSTLGMVSLFNLGYFNRCAVISHWILICISVMSNDVEHVFMQLFAIYICLGEVSIKTFCPFVIGLFVFLVLSFESSLYILHISPSSDVWFVNIFSQSVAYIFLIEIFIKIIIDIHAVIRNNIERFSHNDRILQKYNIISQPGQKSWYNPPILFIFPQFCLYLFVYMCLYMCVCVCVH